jgi:hypothetical protein
MVSGGLRIVHSDLLRCAQKTVIVAETVAKKMELQFPAEEPRKCALMIGATSL